MNEKGCPKTYSFPALAGFRPGASAIEQLHCSLPADHEGNCIVRHPITRELMTVSHVIPALGADELENNETDQ